MPTYDCGCINEVDAPSGVLKNISKCEFHRNWSRDHSQGESVAYFKDIGALDAEGRPDNAHYITELTKALSDDDRYYLYTGERKRLIEFGAGLGPYVPFFLRYGWYYSAVERSDFACDWLTKVFYVPLYHCAVNEYFETAKIKVDCIFGAHIFEHLPDAPGALRQAYEHLTERLYLIVPDDGDPTNPDHLWFFTQTTLHNLLEKIGFRNVRSTVKKVVPQENFIYCVAEK